MFLIQRVIHCSAYAYRESVNHAFNLNFLASHVSGFPVCSVRLSGRPSGVTLFHMSAEPFRGKRVGFDCPCAAGGTLLPHHRNRW